MRVRDERDELLFEERLRFVHLLIHGTTYDRDVETAFLSRAALSAQVLGGDANVREPLRVVRSNSLHRFPQSPPDSHVQWTRPRADGLREILELTKRRQRRLRALEQHRAVASQFDAVAAPDEQGCTQLALELLHLFGQRWL